MYSFRLKQENKIYSANSSLNNISLLNNVIESEQLFVDCATIWADSQLRYFCSAIATMQCYIVLIAIPQNSINPISQEERKAYINLNSDGKDQIKNHTDASKSYRMNNYLLKRFMMPQIYNYRAPDNKDKPNADYKKNQDGREFQREWVDSGVEVKLYPCCWDKFLNTSV